MPLIHCPLDPIQLFRCDHTVTLRLCVTRPKESPFLCRPALVDWNGDGRLDVLVASVDGIRYYEPWHSLLQLTGDAEYAMYANMDNQAEAFPLRAPFRIFQVKPHLRLGV